jgi:hypothetical protein
MTDDLVERLQLEAMCSDYHVDELNEAADEILRLRARLQDIANFSLYGDYSNAYEMPRIALRALAGEVKEND